MRKLLFLLMFFITGIASYAINDCGLFITTNFESECVLTDYKRDPGLLLDESVCFQACQGSWVKYYAEGVDSDGDFEWEVAGAEEWSVISPNEISVHWQDDALMGNVTITYSNDDGSSCSFTRCIELLLKPTAGITSLPEADYSENPPVLYVCLDTEVQFFDNSEGSADSPIVGYSWEMYPELEPYTTTENFTVNFHQPGDFQITHMVINECGCVDRTAYRVVVGKDPNIKFRCYGTACGGSTVKYMTEADCSNFVWEIEGGSLVAQEGPEITVQWDNPESGYGLIRLDGSQCEGICNENSYVSVPIISDGVQIQGPQEVCEGDVVYYELPLWGATHYEYSISPNTGFAHYASGIPNKSLIMFYQPGTYTINCKYENEVLPDCGMHYAEPITVTVNPKLEIEGNFRVCPTDFFDLSTVDNTNATWKVYDESENLVYQNYNHSNVIFGLDNAGNYELVVSSPNACNEIHQYITVIDPPGALPLDSIHGPHEVCLNSSAQYSANVSDPMCYVNWYCECSNPSSFSGPEFTANFGSEICDIKVTQIDQITGCISSETVYSVEQFHLDPVVWNAPDEVCANQLVDVSVEEEEGILYEWSTSNSLKADMIDEDPYSPTNQMQVYDVPNSSFYLIIQRTYCGNIGQSSFKEIEITNGPIPDVIIPEEVCRGDVVVPNYTNSSELTGSFTWHMDDVQISNSKHPIIDFLEEGQFKLSLTYQHSTCDPVVVIKQVIVNPSPVVSVSDYEIGTNNYFTAVVQNGVNGQTFDYLWSTGQTTPTIQVVPNVEYSLTVTSDNGCTVGWGGSIVPPDVCEEFDVNKQPSIYGECQDFGFYASGYPNDIEKWTVNNKPYDETISGSDDQYFSHHFSIAGIYDVKAHTHDDQGDCWTGETIKVIPCVPDFEVYFSCDETNDQNVNLQLNNTSTFLDGINIISSGSKWVIDGISKPYGTSEVSLTAGVEHSITLIIKYSYTFPATGYTYNNTCDVTMDLDLPQRGVAEFTVDDYPKFCSGTPVHFNNESDGDIVSSYWNFGNNANLKSFDGNTVYYYTGTSPYNNAYPKLTITDNFGCQSTYQKSLIIRPNKIDINNIIGIPDEQVCTNDDKYLKVTFNGQILSSYNYHWKPFSETITTNQYDINQTANYAVVVTNSYNCMDRSNWKNVGFLNTPVAQIAGLTSYCKGDAVQLYGNLGDGYNYHWDVTKPNGTHLSFSTPNLSFEANTVGEYSVAFTVQNESGDCSDETTCLVQVHGNDPAPEIEFGNNACLSNGPVQLISSNAIDLYWSNGVHYKSSYFFAPGIATAYTINPETGCKSKFATHYIARQPDFDALLTGCYQRCPEFFANHLYSFMMFDYQWHWFLDGSEIDHGESQTSVSLMLPEADQGFGNYHMEIEYGEGCLATSPVLTLEKKKYCDEKLEFLPREISCEVKDCNLIIHWSGNVVNEGNGDAELLSLHHPACDVIDFPSGLVVNANSSTDFYFQFVLNNYNLQHVNFEVETIYGGVPSWVNFEIDLSEPGILEKCMNPKCQANLKEFKLVEQNGSINLYSFVISYEASFMEVQLYSSTGTIVDYNYNPDNGEIHGFINFATAFVNNHLDSNTDFCFTLYGCHSDFICQLPLCHSYDHLFNWSDMSSEEFDEDNSETNEDIQIGLQPNPASDNLSIVGLDENEIQAYHIFDMNARIVKSGKQTNLSISDLKNGMYVMRIDFKDGNVEYCRFIKE